ncbi:MAG TPA: hypothetical protein VFT45_23345 [Longimicrobium sp.]|nr:hypothetical protein [Longimicrobium sp.]
MLTMVFQWASLSAYAVFGVLALLVGARDRAARPEHVMAWSLSGVAFTLHGVNAAAQVGFGTWAYAAGEGTPVYVAYMRFGTLFNHSRTFALLAFAVALIVLARRATLPRHFLRFSTAGILACMALGAFAGFMEGAFIASRHFVAVAQWDVVELLAMLIALFALLLSSRVDRLLWFALCVYAFSLALNVVWFAALSRWGVPGEWSPKPWHAQFYRFLLTSLMVAIAIRRLQLWKQGKPVPDLLGGEPHGQRMVQSLL